MNYQSFIPFIKCLNKVSMSWSLIVEIFNLIYNTCR